MISHSIVNSLFNYDQEQGLLIWKTPLSFCTTTGDVAGCVGTSGYIQVGINGRLFQAHRLIWLWKFGYIPETGIDHIDRDRTNNRLSNLREISPQCNTRNSKVSKSNKTTVKGVYWDNTNHKWQAQIKVDYKQKGLGRFSDFTEAVAHRFAAEQCLGWNSCDSNSSAYIFMTS